MEKNNLKKFYEKIKTGKIKYFFGSKHIYKYLSENYSSYFNNNHILELGCGNMSNFSILKRFKFKKYIAVDWIKFQKLRQFDDRVTFHKKNILNFIKSKNYSNYFDLIFTVGTFEHFLNPWKTIRLLKKKIKKNGKIIIAYPNYYNPRGLCLITLKFLLNLKISLSDKFYFNPFEFKKKLSQMGYSNIKIVSIHHTGGYGKIAFKDLNQRLPKIFKNKKNFNKNNFLKYFKNYCSIYHPNQYSGQIIIISAKIKK